MICQNCNKNVNKPLELYNGDWACPLCKTVLSVSSIAVRVNNENDETFKLSELCYLRALKNQKSSAVYEQELGTAIAYCRTAARMGNPKALIRLGYFYEYGYLTADVLESFKIAYEYYKLVWSSIPEMEEKVRDADYAEGCKKLRNAAARHYLELLKKLPESFRRVGGLNYHDEKAKIAEKGLFVPDDDSAEAFMEESRITHIFNVLQSCFSKEKSPLFGVMRLEDGEYAELCGVPASDSKNSQLKIIAFAKKLQIVVFDENNGEFQTIKTADDISSYGGGAGYLYFFNANGAHGISERKCVKIGKALRNGNGDYNGVMRIIEAMSKTVGQTDFIFSEDDVLMYKSKLEPIAHATADLINSVSNRSEGSR